jgi:outer membrane protein TolC
MPKGLNFSRKYLIPQVRIFLYLLFIYATTGCVNKEYSIIQLENKYFPTQIEPPPKSDSNVTELFTFQDLFSDPELHSLIEAALAHSPFWHGQLSRVDLAKAKAGLSLSGSQPELQGLVAWQAGKEKSREMNYRTEKLPQFTSRASFGWEFDLWGKWKALREAEMKSVSTENHLILAAQLELIYEISRVWHNMKFLNEDIQLIHDQIRQHHEIHTLHLHRYHAGLEDNSSIIEMEISLKLLASEYNLLFQNFEQTKITMVTLLGSDDSKIPEPPFLSKGKLPPVPSFPHSSVLRNRPDILAGENKIRALVSHLNASSLDLYPSIGIDLTGVGMSGDLSKPFAQWKLQGGPILDIPLWSPKRKLKVAEDKAKLRAAELDWKTLILKGIEEIENSKIRHLYASEELELSQNITHQFQDITEIAMQKFEAGLTSKIDFLKVKIRWTAQKRTLLQKRYDSWVSALDLGKSLGIGWQEIP